jgi:hypothetical protein
MSRGRRILRISAAPRETNESLDQGFSMGRRTALPHSVHEPS